MSLHLFQESFKDVLIVDAHAHLGAYHNFHIPFWQWADCKETAQRLNFSHMFASSTLAIANDAPRGNAALLELVERESDLLSPYLVFKPNFPEYLPELVRISTAGNIRTFKLHDDGNGLAYNHEAYMDFYTWAETQNAVLLFHTFGEIHVRPIMQIAETFKGLTCLLAHSGIVDEDLYVKAALRYDNIYLELANSWSWFGLIERLVKKVGAERVLFGSDMPFLSPEQQLGRIATARISDADKMSILGHNAVRLFGLNPGISA